MQLRVGPQKREQCGPHTQQQLVGHAEVAQYGIPALPHAPQMLACPAPATTYRVAKCRRARALCPGVSGIAQREPEGHYQLRAARARGQQPTTIVTVQHHAPMYHVLYKRHSDLRHLAALALWRPSILNLQVPAGESRMMNRNDAGMYVVLLRRWCPVRQVHAPPGWAHRDHHGSRPTLQWDGARLVVRVGARRC